MTRTCTGTLCGSSPLGDGATRDDPNTALPVPSFFQHPGRPSLPLPPATASSPSHPPPRPHSQSTSRLSRCALPHSGPWRPASPRSPPLSLETSVVCDH